MKLQVQCKCGETVHVEADESAGQEIIDALARCVSCQKCARPDTSAELHRRMTTGTFEPIKPYRQPHND